MPTPQPNLLVRSSRPIGQSGLSPEVNPSRESPICIKVSEDLYEAHLPSLVTPRSSVPGGSSKAIRYAVLEVGQPVFHLFLFRQSTAVEPPVGQ